MFRQCDVEGLVESLGLHPSAARVVYTNKGAQVFLELHETEAQMLLDVPLQVTTADRELSLFVCRDESMLL